MKISITDQKLSASVIHALQSLAESDIPGFQDAAGTIKFIQMIDHMLDFLNSWSKFGTGYKKAIYHKRVSEILVRCSGHNKWAP